MRDCLVVDDHPLTIDGTAIALHHADPSIAVSQARTLAEAMHVLARRPETELVLLDLDLEDSRGIDTLTRLIDACRAHDCCARVVVLSGHTEPELVRAVIDNHGTGFILKSASRESFQRAIALTLAGGIPMPDVPPRAMAPGGGAVASTSAQASPVPDQPLTKREAEVAALLIRGLTYKRIARSLERLDGTPLSEHTVRAHVSNIAWKLGVTENAKAGVMAEIARRRLTFPSRGRL